MNIFTIILPASKLLRFKKSDHKGERLIILFLPTNNTKNVSPTRIFAKHWFLLKNGILIISYSLELVGPGMYLKTLRKGRGGPERLGKCLRSKSSVWLTI